MSKTLERNSRRDCVSESQRRKLVCRLTSLKIRARRLICLCSGQERTASTHMIAALANRWHSIRYIIRYRLNRAAHDQSGDREDQ